MQPYYADSCCTIYLGDCLSVLENISNAYAVITDPPWGIKYKSNHNSAQYKKDGIREYHKECNFKQINGDDKPFNPTIFFRFPVQAYFGANFFCNKLPPSKCWIVWDKRRDTTPDLQSDCELIWTNVSKPSRIFRHLWRGIIREGEENVSKSIKYHPHQKPVALMKFLVEYVADFFPVLDPYCGSGSTLVACKRLNRPSIGIEIDERYAEIAAKRVSTENNKILTHLSN